MFGPKKHYFPFGYIKNLIHQGFCFLKWCPNFVSLKIKFEWKLNLSSAKISYPKVIKVDLGLSTAIALVFENTLQNFDIVLLLFTISAVSKRYNLQSLKYVPSTVTDFIYHVFVPNNNKFDKRILILHFIDKFSLL